MKILIDMTHINIGKLYSSLSIYIFRILKSIEETYKINITLLIPAELENYIKEYYSEYKYIIFSFPSSKILNNRLIRMFVLMKRYKKLVNQSECDILFIANDLCPYTLVKTKLKKVTVIHDLKSIEDQSIIKSSLLRDLYYKFYKKLIKDSTAVIAISNYTKQNILKHYKNIVKPNKISVIYNGVDINEKEIVAIKNLNNIKYILYVNTLQEYKNIETLIKAYIKIKDIITEKIVIVGKQTDYWTNIIMPHVIEHKLQDRIILLENIKDEELHFLYKNASLFVTTSLREGFGYSPIEAAICHCPVISSTCEALVETTMNKLYYYESPKEENELSKKIIEILESPPSFSELEDISKTFKLNYSCKKQTNDIINLLETLVN